MGSADGSGAGQRAARGFIVAETQLALPGFTGVVVRCEFVAAQLAVALRQGLPRQLGVELPVLLPGAVPVRQAEFLAGRYAAQRAMQHLGMTPAIAGAGVGVGAGREPLWPAGLHGSLTHHRRIAVCALSRCGRLIGVDIERYLDSGAMALLTPQIVSVREQILLRSLSPHSPALAAWLLTLVFSAKESLFKALYPQVQRYFDFLDAGLVQLDLQKQQLVLELGIDLGHGFRPGRRFVVMYQDAPDEVLTLVVIG